MQLHEPDDPTGNSSLAVAKVRIVAIALLLVVAAGIGWWLL